MKELKEHVQKYMYLEDTDVLDVALASVVATRLKLGDPVWLLIIGESSGGKSQIIRPITLTDEKYLHSVDDITENTFLSGTLKEKSFLHRVGTTGILSMNDMTVLFSKNSEARSAILSQLRMIYDGKLVKMVGTSEKPIVWKGQLGIIGGCTPMAYKFFEEFADMGERFIYYRMRANDPIKATKMALQRPVFGKALDTVLSDAYAEYIMSVCTSHADTVIPELEEAIVDKLIDVAALCCMLRAPTNYDPYEREVVDIPTPEMPMRVTLQLKTMLNALRVMRHHETGEWDVTAEMMHTIRWTAFSLASEKKRAILACLTDGREVANTNIANTIGLSDKMTKVALSSLSAVGVVEKIGTDAKPVWKIKSQKYDEIISLVAGKREVVEVEVEEEQHF